MAAKYYPSSRESLIMDVTKMLTELKAEREAIEEAIVTLERLARGQGRRRGRPPSWLAALRKGKGVPVSLPKSRQAPKSAVGD
jgi:hypothetical protein